MPQRSSGSDELRSIVSEARYRVVVRRQSQREIPIDHLATDGRCARGNLETAVPNATGIEELHPGKSRGWCVLSIEDCVRRALVIVGQLETKPIVHGSDVGPDLELLSALGAQVRVAIALRCDGGNIPWADCGRERSNGVER